MPGGKLSVASKWLRCLVFNSVAFTDMTDILLGGNMTDTEFGIISSVLQE